MMHYAAGVVAGLAGGIQDALHSRPPSPPPAAGPPPVAPGVLQQAGNAQVPKVIHVRPFYPGNVGGVYPGGGKSYAPANISPRSDSVVYGSSAQGSVYASSAPNLLTSAIARENAVMIKLDGGIEMTRGEYLYQIYRKTNVPVDYWQGMPLDRLMHFTNRNNPQDFRSDVNYGPIPQENLREESIFRRFPVNDHGKLRFFFEFAQGVIEKTIPTFSFWAWKDGSSSLGTADKNEFLRGYCRFFLHENLSNLFGKQLYDEDLNVQSAIAFVELFYRALVQPERVLHDRTVMFIRAVYDQEIRLSGPRGGTSIDAIHRHASVESGVNFCQEHGLFKQIVHSRHIPRS